MKTKSKLGIALILFNLLPFTAPVYSGLIQTSEQASSQEILSRAGVEQHSLRLISVSPLVVEGKTIGEIVVYDEPNTRRPADCFGLYDIAGDLVAVGWFDQFGIQRIAVDRALIQGRDEPEGTFVYLVDGQPI